MNFHQRLRARRAAARAVEAKPVRTWDPKAGLWYCGALPTELLEPICERISRVQGESFDRLVASIRSHGLANPLITVSELPEQNINDWREWRYRFLYTIAAPIKVVVGHNRYAAISALGWKAVPVIHCGRIPPCAAEDPRALWIELEGVDEAQRLCQDGKLGLGPYSLVMDQFTPPLKAMPEGFEGDDRNQDGRTHRGDAHRDPARRDGGARAVPRARRDADADVGDGRAAQGGVAAPHRPRGRSSAPRTKTRAAGRGAAKPPRH